MIDTVMIAIADVCHGAGSFIEGIFRRQPKVEDLRKQVISFQDSLDQLEAVFQQQANETDLLVMHYNNLKFYQVFQRNTMRGRIQDELVCQYAALDYLTILINAAESGAKLSRDDLDFYRTYCKMFADGQIDAEELRTLQPIMRARHKNEIDSLQRCSLDHILNRIRSYK